MVEIYECSVGEFRLQMHGGPGVNDLVWFVYGPCLLCERETEYDDAAMMGRPFGLVWAARQISRVRRCGVDLWSGEVSGRRLRALDGMLCARCLVERKEGGAGR
jgi:hypothetical protein